MSLGREWVVVLHGGAGALIDDNVSSAIEVAMYEAAENCRQSIDAGGRGLDVVVAGLSSLESCEFFDAGYGAFPRDDGIIQLDVSLIDDSGKFFAISGIEKIRHPSRLALHLYDQASSSLFCGFGTSIRESVASYSNELRDYLGVVQSHADLLAPFATKTLETIRKRGLDATHGTVGCVVRDPLGRVYAGTSTGGTPSAPLGRIGDSPIIGAGSFALRGVAALSATGHGEYFLAAATTAFAAYRLQETGLTNSDVRSILEEELGRMCLQFPRAEGGLIAVTTAGAVGSACTTEIMPAALLVHGAGRSEIFANISGKLECF